MKKTVLIRANKEIKKSRPNLPSEQICQVFHTMQLLEITFLSKQCRYDSAGTCMMCDYGCFGDTCRTEIYVDEMKNILSAYNGQFECLLLSTNGSFMDEYQIPSELYCSLLIEVGKFDIPEIDIETHYSSVTREKLQCLKDILGSKKIAIEMGLETSNPRYQDCVIMKNIDLLKFEKTILMIKEFNFNVELNVMLGMPFLSDKEQLDDALNTVQWVYDRQCKPIIFLMNIKPFTLLSHMYDNGYYSPISHWLAIILIDSIDVKKIDNLTVAWYGNREEPYQGSKKRAVFPTSCPKCYDLIMAFYIAFNSCPNANERKLLIHGLKNSIHCNCYKSQLGKLKNIDTLAFEEKYEAYSNSLIKDFGGAN